MDKELDGVPMGPVKPEEVASTQNMADDDQFYHEAKMSFAADTRYSDAYHNDAYDPEKYNYMRGIFTSIQTHMEEFVMANPKFDPIRMMDISKLKPGDNVSVSNSSDKKVPNIKACSIKSIEGDIFTLMCGNVEIVVMTRDIKVMDEAILRLKGADISFMYNTFKKSTNTESHVDFFYAFTEYFKMNEKQVYDSLSNRVKNEILEELNDRTGCIKKMNVFQW